MFEKSKLGDARRLMENKHTLRCAYTPMLVLLVTMVSLCVFHKTSIGVCAAESLFSTSYGSQFYKVPSDAPIEEHEHSESAVLLPKMRPADGSPRGYQERSSSLLRFARADYPIANRPPVRVPIRLVDGDTFTDGRVEIRPLDEEPWGTVCSNVFKEDRRGAIAVCTTMGYAEGAQLGNSHFVSFGSGNRSAPIWMDGVNCTGAMYFDNCTHKPLGEHVCTHGDDSGVRCVADPSLWQFKLVNGPVPTRGVVLFRPFPHLPWGTVEAKPFNDPVLGLPMRKALCRSLGFGNKESSAGSDDFFPVTTREYEMPASDAPTYMRPASCGGEPYPWYPYHTPHAQSMQNCSMDGYMQQYSWSPSDALQLICDEFILFDELEVRLVNGPFASAGQIQFRTVTITAIKNGGNGTNAVTQVVKGLWEYIAASALLSNDGKGNWPGDDRMWGKMNHAALNAVCHQAGFSQATTALFRHFGVWPSSGVKAPAAVEAINCGGGQPFSDSSGVRFNLSECNMTRARGNDFLYIPAGVDCYPERTVALAVTPNMWEYRLYNPNRDNPGSVTENMKASMGIAQMRLGPNATWGSITTNETNNFGLWDAFCNAVGNGTSGPNSSKPLRGSSRILRNLARFTGGDLSFSTDRYSQAFTPAYMSKVRCSMKRPWPSAATTPFCTPICVTTATSAPITIISSASSTQETATQDATNQTALNLTTALTNETTSTSADYNASCVPTQNASLPTDDNSTGAAQGLRFDVGGHRNLKVAAAEEEGGATAELLPHGSLFSNMDVSSSTVVLVCRSYAFIRCGATAYTCLANITRNSESSPSQPSSDAEFFTCHRVMASQDQGYMYVRFLCNGTEHVCNLNNTAEGNNSTNFELYDCPVLYVPTTVISNDTDVGITSSSPSAANASSSSSLSYNSLSLTSSSSHTPTNFANFTFSSISPQTSNNNSATEATLPTTPQTYEGDAKRNMYIREGVSPLVTFCVFEPLTDGDNSSSSNTTEQSPSQLSSSETTSTTTVTTSPMPTTTITTLPPAPTCSADSGEQLEWQCIPGRTYADFIEQLANDAVTDTLFVENCERDAPLLSSLSVPAKVLALDCDTGATTAQERWEVRINGSAGLVEFRPGRSLPWGMVCTTDLDTLRALCHLAGYTATDYVEYIPTQASQKDVDNFEGPFNYLYNLRCPSGSRSWEACTFDHLEGERCPTNGHAAVDCFAVPNRPDLWTFRLVNQNNVTGSSGRVEIMPVPGADWGTICDDGWNQANTVAICNSLGFDTTNRTVQPRARLCNSFSCGTSTQTVWIDDATCPRRPFVYFQNCSQYTWRWHNCGHSEDVAVDCLPPIPNLQEMEYRGKQVDPLNFPGYYRIEARQPGVSDWGTIRETSSIRDSVRDARVACWTINISTPYAEFIGGGHKYSDLTKPVIIQNYRCPEEATTLYNCTPDIQNFLNSDLDHTYDWIVDCNAVYDDPSQWRFRLAGGPNNASGRLEILPLPWATWGTVCDDSWTAADSIAACMSLGFNYTKRIEAEGSLSVPPRRVDINLYLPGKGPIWLDDMTCPARPFDYLQNCSSYTFKFHNCGHGEDVALQCESPVFFPERFEYRFIPRDPAIPKTGRVEMRPDNASDWGTIYQSQRSLSHVARAACLSVGFSDVHAWYETTLSGSGPVYVMNWECPPWVTHFRNCTFDPAGYGVTASHSYDLTVECDYAPDDPKLWEFRLANSTQPGYGRVEMRAAPWQQWGTINGLVWSIDHSVSVCRSLNFTEENGYAPIHAQYTTNLRPAGTGRTWIHYAYCPARPFRYFQECSSYYWRYSPYDHTRDVWVDCTPRIQARIVGGPDPSRGRVEIKYNNWTNVWGTLCNDNFIRNHHAWIAVCRTAGFNTSYAAFEEWGEGTGAINMDDTWCPAGAKDLNDCTFRQIGTHNCGHSEDAGVDCFPPPENRSRWEFKFAGAGSTRTGGRIEMRPNPNEPWGVVCDKFFNYTYVAWLAACRTMGVKTIRARPRNYGPGYGPIYLDNATCTLESQTLNDCSFFPVGSYDCTPADAAGIDCDPPAEEPERWEFRLNGATLNPSNPLNISRYGFRKLTNDTSNTTVTAGTLEVRFSKAEKWGTVCNDGLTLLVSQQRRVASIVCRSVGIYNRKKPPRLYTSNSNVGEVFPLRLQPSWKPIVLAGLNCPTGSRTIADCFTDPIYSHGCTRAQNIHVDCLPQPPEGAGEDDGELAPEEPELGGPSCNINFLFTVFAPVTDKDLRERDITVNISLPEYVVDERGETHLSRYEFRDLFGKFAAVSDENVTREASESSTNVSSSPSQQHYTSKPSPLSEYIKIYDRNIGTNEPEGFRSLFGENGQQPRDAPPPIVSISVEDKNNVNTTTSPSRLTYYSSKPYGGRVYCEIVLRRVIQCTVPRHQGYNLAIEDALVVEVLPALTMDFVYPSCTNRPILYTTTTTAPPSTEGPQSTSSQKTEPFVTTALPTTFPLPTNSETTGTTSTTGPTEKPAVGVRALHVGELTQTMIPVHAHEKPTGVQPFVLSNSKSSGNFVSAGRGINGHTDKGGYTTSFFRRVGNNKKAFSFASSSSSSLAANEDQQSTAAASHGYGTVFAFKIVANTPNPFAEAVDVFGPIAGGVGVVSAIFAGANPMDMQIIALLTQSECMAEVDRRSTSMLRYFTSPLYDLGYVAIAFGNLGVTLGFFGLQYALARQLIASRRISWIDAWAATRFPSYSYACAQLLFVGVCLGSLSLVNGASLSSSTVQESETKAAWASYFLGAVGCVAVIAIISTIVYISINVVVAKFVQYTQFLSRPWYYRWLYPLGFWENENQRVAFGYLLNPYRQGQKLKLFSVSNFITTIVTSIIMLMDFIPCFVRFVIVGVSFFIVAALYLLLRPARCPPNSIMTVIQQSGLAILSFLSAAAYVKPTVGLMNGKLAFVFIQILLIIVRACYTIVIRYHESRTWRKFRTKDMSEFADDEELRITSIGSGGGAEKSPSSSNQGAYKEKMKGKEEEMSTTIGKLLGDGFEDREEELSSPPIVLSKEEEEDVKKERDGCKKPLRRGVGGEGYGEEDDLLIFSSSSSSSSGFSSASSSSSSPKGKRMNKKQSTKSSTTTGTTTNTNTITNTTAHDKPKNLMEEVKTDKKDIARTQSANTGSSRSSTSNNSSFANSSDDGKGDDGGKGTESQLELNQTSQGEKAETEVGTKDMAAQSVGKNVEMVKSANNSFSDEDFL